MSRGRYRGPAGPTPGSAADDQPDADPEQVARTVVLRRLSASPRSRHELEADLLRRDVPSDVVERVLDRFTDVGLIDDAEYARMWVDSRQRTRGTARSVLRQELRAKGIDDDTASTVLATIDNDSERERGRLLVVTRLNATARFDPAVRERRLVGLLVRRGYPSGVAYSIVREVLAEDAQ